MIAAETVDVLTSADALGSLRSEWGALGVDDCGTLVSFDWFASAARQLCEPASLRVVTVRRAGALVAVAPLCLQQSRGLVWLETLGARVLHEPTQLLASDERALASLCAAIVGLHRPVIIQRLRVDDPAIDLLRSAAAGAGGRFRLAERAATNHVPAGRPDAMSSRRRKKLRYFGRLLEARGVKVELSSPTPEEVPEIFETFVQVERAGWKGRAGSSLASRPELRAFFADQALALARRGQLRVWLLSGERSPVAAQLCAEAAGRVWVLKIGFDEAWARYSPGIVLTAEAVAYARQRGLAFEFLGSAEEWQSAWQPDVRRHCAAIVYPRSVAGLAARALDGGVEWARRVMRGLRIGAQHQSGRDRVSERRDTGHANRTQIRENSATARMGGPTVGRDVQCVG